MLISELLPNPVGKDSDGEFIELWNNGQASVSLLGWTLKDKSGKVAQLSGTVPSGGYRVFRAAQTKITLNQSAETITLLDPVGRVVDRATYLGAAPEGSSYARKGSEFFFTPLLTPGAANEFPALQASVFHEAPYGTIGASDSSSVLALTLGVLVAATLSALAVWVIRLISHEPAALTYEKPLPY
jgi:hypothetical protein